MKKVVHLTSAHPRYDQRILWRECCSLCEQGYDITLIVNDAQENETVGNGVRILSTGFVPKGRKERMTEGVKKIYELGLAQDADVYHLHDPELLTIALKLKRQGKKVIFDSHEIHGEDIRAKKYIPLLARHMIASAYTAYETYVCRRIDGVVIPTRFDGRDVFEGRCKRFATVGNYPRTSEYEGIEAPPFRGRRGVCYSGSLTPQRGITILAEAGKTAGAEIVLVGSFSSEAYKEEILASGPKGIIQYLGFINTRKELFSIYARCAVGASLLLDDGQFKKIDIMPTKVYEYMAMEMPVLISDFPYNRKLIEKYRFGLVANPDDANDIAAKMRWLLDHPKEAETMGKNGKRLLVEQFTWDVAEKKLLKLYQEIEQN